LHSGGVAEEFTNVVFVKLKIFGAGNTVSVVRRGGDFVVFCERFETGEV
jgi:hypothetical protein